MTGNGTGDVAALREEIRRTRVELGETVELLAARADPKALVRHSAEQAKARMREQASLTAARVRGRAAERARLVRAQAYEKGEAVGRNPLPWAAIAAGALVTVVVLAIVRGRRR
ncbi:DUF3618 domain-containing protein [Micromonospora chalcea]|uniref:ElaB/YqjD/DUF883 family membrane-anchored ribosome-binding protein n=1 Tax=Micromonospora echinospora TaxID=1877 RepID=A0ABR6MCR4_MICEC|nr:MULTISPECIES: DUF3618 domain-containing protein [Micromonospora]AXO37566.1 DNA mismatch repair protein MutS [Micromonospora sp. B006]MBB5113037.1 ElaB/YqjD/DUF883 family membrane-anchored ribosome-binding protein [Micromonospora echinospora]